MGADLPGGVVAVPLFLLVLVGLIVPVLSLVVLLDDGVAGDVQVVEAGDLGGVEGEASLSLGVRVAVLDEVDGSARLLFVF